MPRRKPDQPGKTGRPRNMVAELEDELFAQLRQGHDLPEAARIAGIDLQSVLRYAAGGGVNGAFGQRVARASQQGTTFALAGAEAEMARARDHMELARAEKKASHYMRKAKAQAAGGQDDGSDKPEAKPVDLVELGRSLAFTLSLSDRAAGKVAEPTAPLMPGMAKPPADKRAERKPEPTPAELEQEEERRREEALAEADAEGKRATEAEIRMSLREDQRRSIHVNRYSRRSVTAPKPR